MNAVFAFGVVSGGLGGAACAGLWRSWTGRLHESVVFGWFWLGAAVLSIGLATAVVRTPVFALSFVFTGVAIVTGSIGFWVMLSGPPRRLQLKWYRQGAWR